MTENNDREVLSRQDLATRWEVSMRTLAEMRARGELPPSFKVGRTVRYRLEDVKEWERKRVGRP